MADQQNGAPTSNEQPFALGSVRNSGEPLRFANIEPLAGFSAEVGNGGQEIQIWTKLGLTSDDPSLSSDIFGSTFLQTSTP